MIKAISFALLLTTIINVSKACKGVDPYSLKLYFEKNKIPYEEDKLVEKCEELPPVRVVGYYPKNKNGTLSWEIVYAMDGLGIPKDALIVDEDNEFPIHSKFGCGSNQTDDVREG